MATRPWTPEQDLSSALVAHWDATSGLTVAAGTVSQWVDKFAGIAATQSTASAQPTYSATGLNNCPALHFDGSASQLAFTPTSAFPSGSAAGTTAFSASSDSTAGGSYRYGFGYGGANDGGQRSIGSTNNGTGSVAWTEAGSDAISSVPWVGATHFTIAQYAAGSSTLDLAIDGTDQGNFAIKVPSTTLDIGAIGSFVGYALLWQGWVQDCLVFNRVLTTIERQLLEGWESWKNGKNGSNLPTNHPYCSAAPTVSSGGTARRRPMFLMAA